MGFYIIILGNEECPPKSDAAESLHGFDPHLWHRG